jgi:hypothetical protein
MHIPLPRIAHPMLLCLLYASSAHAMDARIVDVRRIGPTVRATIDLHDMFTPKFGEILGVGGALHVRVQAEIWEDRPLWDRLVRPALVTVFRIVRDPATSGIAISDAFGQVQASPDVPNPLSFRVDVVAADALQEKGRYYLRVSATVGTLAERDAAEAGEAVFGQDDGTVSLGKMGKMIFNAVLQATDYLQSVSAEARSRQFEGHELRK